MEQGSFKDFESVRLKATYEMDIGKKHFQPGETLLYFDKIQIAGLQELRSRVAARGGFDNRAHVWWDTTKEIQLSFSRGVFSKEQFSLLTNAKMYEISANYGILVTQREYLESDANGYITCKYTPAHNIYVYDASTGTSINFTQDGKKLLISSPYTNVIVDYEFDYQGKGTLLTIGRRLINGYVSLEGQTRVKDDTTGQVVTGLIKIPHLKLMSDLSIRLGAQASPIVANFQAIGVPVGSRGDSYVSEWYYLSDDLTSDL